MWGVYIRVKSGEATLANFKIMLLFFREFRTLCIITQKSVLAILCSRDLIQNNGIAKFSTSAQIKYGSYSNSSVMSNFVNGTCKITIRSCMLHILFGSNTKNPWNAKNGDILPLLTTIWKYIYYL